MGLLALLLGLLALLCAIAGVLSAWVPVLGAVLAYGAPLLGTVGLLVGGIAISRDRAAGRPPQLAWAGSTLSLLGFLGGTLVASTCGVCNLGLTREVAVRATGAAFARPEPSRQTSGVIVYGASWCEACTEAEGYLRRRGVPFVVRDVQHDAAAAREAARLTGSGDVAPLPVIDFRGHVLVGFDPAELDPLIAARR